MVNGWKSIFLVFNSYGNISIKNGVFIVTYRSFCAHCFDIFSIVFGSKIQRAIGNKLLRVGIQGIGGCVIIMLRSVNYA